MTGPVVEGSMRFLILITFVVQTPVFLSAAESDESPSIGFRNLTQEPKRLEFKERMTLLQALTLGGVKADSSVKRVALIREGQRSTYHIVSDLKANPRKDIKLKANDQIMVCSNEIIRCDGTLPPGVWVNGEVKQPARIEFAQGMTLLDAIAAVGGFTRWAD
jgi:protein involved in polysaccharide export with SLBB domain